MLWKNKKKYYGVVVPMITPFTQKGTIDLPATQRITEHLIKGGTYPFILGTTGEGSSIPISQRIPFVKAVVNQINGRSTIYAGIGNNCIDDSVEAAKKYLDLGIDVVVAQLPSYYPLSPDDMLRYFATLADRIPGPLVVYNIPLTTHMSIPLEIIDKLSQHPKIVALKDSENDEERFKQAIALWINRKDFSHLAGTEDLAIKALSLGSDGLVPSTGNIVPRIYRNFYDAICLGNKKKATTLLQKTKEISQIYLQYKTLNRSLPALKFIMNNLGFCEDMVLPPLCAISPNEKFVIQENLKILKSGCFEEH